MDNLNASLTDKTGKEIVEAIQAIAGGGGSSDSLTMRIHVVTEYPGEGEDPYAGTYDGESPHDWLDLTVNEIDTALRNGKIIIATQYEVYQNSYENIDGTIVHTNTIKTFRKIVEDIETTDDPDDPDPIRVIINSNTYYGARTMNDYPYSLGNR